MSIAEDAPVNAAAEHPFPPRYYEVEGDVFVPTPLARSPWDGKAIAGGPVSALLASCAEDAALDADFEIARFQVDIFGKVPHQPLGHASEVLRDGRQTKLHRITLLADEYEQRVQAVAAHPPQDELARRRAVLRLTDCTSRVSPELLTPRRGVPALLGFDGCAGQRDRAGCVRHSR